MLQLAHIFLLTNTCQNQRENVINNNCDFDILRIKKSDIMCSDYGTYVKYCNHYSLPQEFLVYNENGINGKHITIKPSAMWKETDNNKVKLADFYYTFTCDNRDKEPRLIQHIVPKPEHDTNPLFMLIFLVLIVIIICTICPPDSNDGFWFGYLMGSGGGSRSRTYCD
jgi:hypothetical protein